MDIMEDPLIQSMEEDTFLGRLRRIAQGLKAPKDSGEHKYAVFQLQRIMGPGGASFLVCSLAVWAMIMFVAFREPPEPPTLDVTIMEPQTEEIDDIEEQKVEIEPDPEVVQLNDVDDVSFSDVNHDDGLTDPDRYGIEDSDQMLPAVAQYKSPLILRGLYGNRTPKGRQDAIGRFGGSGQGESAVLRALRWLKQKQNSDGSWTESHGDDGTTAFTGLALLCYLAHGETPASPEFGQTVEMAIRFLTGKQGADGSLCHGGRHAYAHAIGAYALCEAYGMTKMVLLKDAAEKATQVILSGQQAGGTYGEYGYTSAGTRKDTSIMGWNIQALKAAYIAGLDVPGLMEGMQKAKEGLMQNYGDGGFGYSGPGVSQLTAAGVLCMQLLGFANDPATTASLQTMDQKYQYPIPGSHGSYWYHIYYACQANFHSGGERWKRWNSLCAPDLVKTQIVEDGKEGKKIGHWEHGNQYLVMGTTLACLSLEVYYRFLPTYQRPEDGLIAPPELLDAAAADDEVKIEIEKAL